jgi:tetratricopeptide (TPR) repeat protein
VTPGEAEDVAGLIVALTADPAQSAEVWLALARRLYLAGRYGEGEHWTARAVKQHPGAYALWNIRGVMLRQLQRPEEALAALDQAIALAPEETSARANRGSVLLDLAQAATARGDPAGAEAILDRALAASPDDSRLLEAKALMLRASGQLGRARTFLEELEPRLPDAAWLHFHLGDLLAETDRPRGNTHLRRALELEPAVLDHRIALIQSLERSTAADEGERLDEAWSLCGPALAGGGLKPAHSKVLRDVFTRVCAFDAGDALGDFRATGRGWAESGLHTALLRQMGRVRTSEDRLELLEQHRIWGRAVEARAALAPIHKPAPRPRDGRIRLGFMSSDLRRHPVSFFALPLFDHIDRGRFEVFCYSFYRGEEDALQAHIAARATAFRWMPDAGVRDAAQVIADDDLDLLIELGGSTLMNKLEVMAYRPAPRQASWLGYPHSAGLAAIDHFICDPWSAPTDPALMLEMPLVMPSTWIAFSESVFEGHPAITEGLPQDRAGWLTFGTANAPYKFTREGLRTWARIVAAVPRSRFAFVRPEAGSATFRAHVLAEFAAEGVSADRVAFHAVRGAHMPYYNGIDISLDSFPLTGGTTTAEALWMGVPVVSLKGQAFYERLSYSILTNAGLGDLAADDLEGFVGIALKLAADRPRLQALRSGLREQIRQSPLGRTEAFARDFYDLVAGLVAG